MRRERDGERRKQKLGSVSTKNDNAKVLFHTRRSENDFGKPFIVANSKKGSVSIQKYPATVVFRPEDPRY